MFHRFHQKQNRPGDEDDDVMSSSFPLSTMFSSFFLLSDTDANAEYEKLHNYFSPIIEKQVWEQRGFYIKHAQFLSTRDDFVPEKYLEWCKKVQDQAPTKLEKGEALKIAEESLRGTKYENAIEYWEETPIGVASIGAVHRCRLRGESKTCVVKVQAPEVENRFRNDVDTMIFFLRLFQPQHVRGYRLPSKHRQWRLKWCRIACQDGRELRIRTKRGLQSWQWRFARHI